MHLLSQPLRLSKVSAGPLDKGNLLNLSLTYLEVQSLMQRHDLDGELQVLRRIPPYLVV